MDGIRFSGIGPGLKLPEVGQPIAVRVAPRTVVAPTVAGVQTVGLFPIVQKDRLPPVSTVENVIDRSLIFNACFPSHALVPLLPDGHHQVSRKFSMLKLTPVPCP